MMERPVKILVLVLSEIRTRKILLIMFLAFLSFLCFSLCSCSRSAMLTVPFPDAVHFFSDKYGVDLTRSRSATVYLDPARSGIWKEFAKMSSDAVQEGLEGAPILPMLMMMMLRSDDSLAINVNRFEKDDLLVFKAGPLHYRLQNNGPQQTNLRVRCTRRLFAIKGGYFDFTASQEREELANVKEEIRTGRYKVAFTRSRLKKNLVGSIDVIKTLPLKKRHTSK